MVSIAKFVDQNRRMQHRSRDRGGVLLLIVVSVLTLFVMLGATYLAIATRARRTAKSFADNVVAITSTAATEDALLDAAFLAVARGTTARVGGTDVAHLGTGEDILGDKYGVSTLVGRVAAANRFMSSPAFIELQCTAISLSPNATAGASLPTFSSDLVGRVITITLPGLAASTRIMKATGSITAPTLVIPAGPTVTGKTLSATDISRAIARLAGSQPSSIIINDREFAGDITAATTKNEPYDGFDNRNPLLTRILPPPTSGGSPSVDAALLSTGASLDADNDSDGVPDSRFIDIGLPTIVPGGTTQAAILVVDLDGRLNVNAHGSGADADNLDPMTGQSAYPTIAPTSANPIPLYQLPRGVTPGPATISLTKSLAFTGTNAGPLQSGTMINACAPILSGQQSARKTVDASGRKIPKLANLNGRYGEAVWDGSTLGTLPSGPGVTGTNDRSAWKSDAWLASVDTKNAHVSRGYQFDPGRFGSPWDVRNQMTVWVDAFGQPIYYKPRWSTAPALNDVVDDPYEVDLAQRGARSGYAFTPPGSSPTPDALFTVAELEGLLRYEDPDSLKLSRRLVALNEDNAARNRLLLTTDSWDTPAVTGTAWHTVIGGTYGTLLSSVGLAAPNRAVDFFAPEILQGRKMDLNRPFHRESEDLNANGVLDAGEDANGNGVLDSYYDEPNDAVGIARRQTFARHLYCLMVSIANANGLTITSTNARQLAQYAVNVVDFRDGDSVMTRFDYDPAFQPSNPVWNVDTTVTGTNYVWGCERPEFLITETLAWHNRRTDDLSVGGSIQVKADDLPNADNDLDQRRRPWGAFFVELYSPWRSRTAAYASGTVSLGAARGEPIPASLTGSGSAAFEASAVVDLDKRVGGSPAWRLVTVRGDVKNGTGFDAEKKIADPASPYSAAVVDRVFYFAQPTDTSLTSPTDPNKNGRSGAIFWATDAPTGVAWQSPYIVVGTDRPQFDYRDAPPKKQDKNSAYKKRVGTFLPYDYQVNVRFGPGSDSARCPATISEPVNTTASNQDPYDTVAEYFYGLEKVGKPNNDKNRFVPDESSEPHFYSDTIHLQSEIDSPVDSLSSPIAGISEPFLLDDGDPTSQKPLLMLNGTHENFAVVHLQRLANPDQQWNALTNPYVTVDSMPVNLTVVNTQDGDPTKNIDEPGETPIPSSLAQPTLTWLRTQKQYPADSYTNERGGKGASGADRDIWSRRINSATMDLSGSAAFRSPATPSRAATALKPPASPGDKYALQFAPSPTYQATLRRTSEDTNDNRVLDNGEDANGNNLLDIGRSAPVRFRVDEDLDGDGFLDPGEDSNGNGELDRPGFAWLAWPNRPFTSAADLAIVPTTSPFDLPARHSISGAGAPIPHFGHLPGFYETATPPAPWDRVFGRAATGQTGLLDFVHIALPYTGLSQSVPATTGNAAALSELGLDLHPLNQVSSFREPGRVNVNTITDRRTWRAIFGSASVRGVSGDTTNPDDPDGVPAGGEPDLRDRIPGWSADLFGMPQAIGTPTRATDSMDMFHYLPDPGSKNRLATPRGGSFIDQFVTEDTNGNGMLDAGEDTNGNTFLDTNDHRNTDRNAYFRYQTLRQLTGVTTVRSNVFAVWITVRSVDSAGAEVSRKRGFYLFDRSIPVAYERGQTHNVNDAIVLRRIIE